MLRTCLVTAGVGALVAMAIGGASFASASSEGGGRTIVVLEKTTSQHFLDLGQPGPTAGDEFFFGSQFWNLAQTHKVGSNHGYCVLETTALLHCAGTAHVAGGTVEYAGETTINGQRFTLAITGGTGALNAAEGHVTVHNLNANGTLSRDVIALTG